MHDTFDSRIKIDSDIYYAVLLHDHLELLDDCCALVNAEWRRSHVARLRSLSGSSSNFPTSVILLKESKEPKVIGHCKLTKISHSCPVVFAEIVVIHPDFRGRGLGKLLMQKAEIYLQSKNIEWIYLTTLEKKEFYEKLGYSQCEPLNIYAGQLNHILENRNELKTTSDSPIWISEQINKNYEETSNQILKSSLSSPSQDIAPSPPPPPPPPMPSSNPPQITYISSKKTFMRKKIFHTKT